MRITESDLTLAGFADHTTEQVPRMVWARGDVRVIAYRANVVVWNFCIKGSSLWGDQYEAPGIRNLADVKALCRLLSPFKAAK